VGLLPHVQALVQRFEDQPFTFLGMYGREGEREAIAARLARERVSWRNAMDLGTAEGGALWSRWAVRGFPQFYLLDDRGVIRGRCFGDPDLDELATRIEGLIAEAQAR
jgi:hypothetical protein